MNQDFYTNQFDVIKKSNTGIKDSSIKAYLGSVKKICKELFDSEKYSLKYFMDTETILNYLESIKNITTRKNVCTAIIVVLKANGGNTANEQNKSKIHQLIPVYSEYHQKLGTEIKDSYLDNQKSEKESKNWVTSHEINEKIDYLHKKLGGLNVKSKDFVGTDRTFVDTFQMYLVLNLYTMIPPVRNDFANMKVLSSARPVDCKDPDFNYIDTENCKLVMCDYKTSGTYGLKSLDLPKDLVDLVKKYEKIKKMYLGPTTGLLVNTTNLQPMKKNSLTKYLNKIFSPKKVSTTILRKVYLSEKYPVTHSMRERERDSIFMGHSVGMASSVYSKKL